MRAVIVTSDLEKLRILRRPLYEADTQVDFVGHWTQAKPFVTGDETPPDLFVVTWDVLEEMDPDGRQRVFTEIAIWDLPAICVYDPDALSADAETEVLTIFRGTIRWPADVGRVGELLNIVVPNIARTTAVFDGSIPSQMTPQVPHAVFTNNTTTNREQRSEASTREATADQAKNDATNDATPVHSVAPPEPDVPAADVVPEAPPESPPAFDPEELPSLPPSASDTTTAWIGVRERTRVFDSQGVRRLLVEMPSLTSGTLERLSVPRLLHYLSVQGRTGTLRLEPGPMPGASAVTLAFNQGQPTIPTTRADTGDAIREVIAAVLDTFAWDAGRYQFEDQTQPIQGTSAEIESLLHAGWTQAVPFESIAANLARHMDNLPIYTTHLSIVRRRLDRVGVADTLQALDGTRELQAVIAETDRPVREQLTTLAFALSADLVAMVPAPIEPPLSVDYRLRPLDMSAVDDDAQNMGRKRPTTLHRIAKLDLEGRTALDELHEVHERFQSSSPYAPFGLEPGCGRDAVERAYFELLGRFHPRQFRGYEGTPVMDVVNLLSRSINERYIVLCERES